MGVVRPSQGHLKALHGAPVRLEVGIVPTTLRKSIVISKTGVTMSRRLTVISGLFALAATSMPANAVILSRTASFLFPCNGTNQTITTNFTGFAATAALQVIGSSLTLFANPGGVQFVTLATNDGVFNVALNQLGQNTNLSNVIFPGQALDFAHAVENATSIVITNAGGVASFSVTGNCTGGAGTPAVQGTFIIWLESQP